MANEKIDARVCSLNSYFDDDLTASCSVCKKTIYYRPFGPIDVEFYCNACTVHMLKEDKWQS